MRAMDARSRRIGAPHRPGYRQPLAEPPEIARGLNAARQGSTIFDLEGRHLGYVGLCLLDEMF